MLVKFKNTWFAPGFEYSKDSRVFSGKRYKKGINEVPNELAPHLPPEPFAEILDKEELKEEQPKKRAETLADYDALKKSADEEVALRKQMSDEDKEKARARAAKARQARLDKLAAQKAEKAKEEAA